MIRVERTRVFPVPVHDLFAIVTDVSCWEKFGPRRARLMDDAGSRWSGPGDAVTMTLRLFGNDVPLRMELEELKIDAYVCYVARQPGFPETRHERRFREVSGGTEYVAIVTFEPRPGLAGLADRVVFRLVVERTIGEMLVRLERYLSRLHDIKRAG